MRGESTRNRILAAIQAQPGITINALSQRTRLRWNAVHHHLRVLEKRGNVEIQRQAWSHEVYAVGVPARYRPWLRALYGADSGRLLRTLLLQGEQGVRQLSQESGLSRPAVRNQLARMMRDGIVHKVGQTRPHYRALETPTEIQAELCNLPDWPPRIP